MFEYLPFSGWKKALESDVNKFFGVGVSSFRNTVDMIDMENMQL